MTVGDWTLGAVKEHFETLRAADELRYQQLREKEQIALNAALLSAEKAVQTALLAAKEAVVKAEIATERRLEGLNELRQGVATKDQLDAMDRRLNELKETVSLFLGTQSGRAGGLKDYIGWIVALAGVVAVILSYVALRR